MSKNLFEKLTNESSRENPEPFGRKLWEDATGVFSAFVEQRKHVADSTYTANLQYAFAARTDGHDDLY